MENSLIVTTTTLPATSIDKFDNYAATGGPGWFGDLLKFSGKTGTWSAGQQNVELKKGTRLVAIVPGMMAGFVKWRDGELIDQVFKPIEGFVPAPFARRLMRLIGPCGPRTRTDVRSIPGRKRPCCR
jgi:hypothetical protein